MSTFATFCTKRDAGFTIIEMMVVIAIIAILGAMVIPTYQERVIIKQIEEGIALAEMAKRPIAAQWASKQVFLADNAAGELPAADKIVNNFVTSIAVQDGVIHITYGNNAGGALKGKIISLRPAVVADAPTVPIAWVCAKANVPAKMTVQGSDRSDVPTHLLPLACRDRKPAN